MDLQKMFNMMNENSARERGGYHLTYGNLIKALKDAPNNAVFDKRIKGIGSWRGSYIEISLYTDEKGYHAEKEEFTDYEGVDYQKRYTEWEKENVVSEKKLPRNANELGTLLESLIGLQFVGYKGGNFTIEEWKPLWLEEDSSAYTSQAVIGIDENMNFITKQIED